MIPTSSPPKAHKTLHLALSDVGSQIAPENWSHYRSTRPLVHADMPSAPARLAAALTADFALANSAAPVVSGSAPAPHRAHHSREAQSAGDPTGARRASGADESTGPALAPPPPAVGEDAPARAQGRAMDAQGRVEDTRLSTNKQQSLSSSGSSNGRSGSSNGRRSAQGPRAGPQTAARGADNDPSRDGAAAGEVYGVQLAWTQISICAATHS